MKKDALISFTLVKIQTLEYAIIEEAFKEMDSDIKFHISTVFSVTNENPRVIVCQLAFSFIQEKIPFIKLKLACYFELKKESWDQSINKEDNTILLSKKFADHLVVLTLGTLRGVLHAKTEGSKFNHFFVPTINISELSSAENIELKLN